jgi:hypothetical protein
MQLPILLVYSLEIHNRFLAPKTRKKQVFPYQEPASSFKIICAAAPICPECMWRHKGAGDFRKTTEYKKMAGMVPVQYRLHTSQ